MQAELSRLPHGEPFVFVDRVIDLDIGRSIRGERLIREDEPWCRGHFPGRPLFPGVLIVEALAQLGGILASASEEQQGPESRGPGPRASGPLLLLAVDKVRLRRPVLPGQTLRLEVTVLGHRSGAWKLRGEASVDGQRCAEAQLLLGPAGPRS